MSRRRSAAGPPGSRRAGSPRRSDRCEGAVTAFERLCPTPDGGDGWETRSALPPQRGPVAGRRARRPRPRPLSLRQELDPLKRAPAQRAPDARRARRAAWALPPGPAGVSRIALSSAAPPSPGARSAPGTSDGENVRTCGQSRAERAERVEVLASCRRAARRAIRAGARRRRCAERRMTSPFSHSSQAPPCGRRKATRRVPGRRMRMPERARVPAGGAEEAQARDRHRDELGRERRKEPAPAHAWGKARLATPDSAPVGRPDSATWTSAGRTPGRRPHTW